jgi:hypothetical protein
MKTTVSFNFSEDSSITTIEIGLECYAQTKVQFKNLHKIFYTKVEGTFKSPSLGFLEQRHQGPKPYPAKDFAKRTYAHGTR